MVEMKQTPGTLGPRDLGLKTRFLMPIPILLRQPKEIQQTPLQCATPPTSQTENMGDCVNYSGRNCMACPGKVRLCPYATPAERIGCPERESF